MDLSPCRSTGDRLGLTPQIGDQDSSTFIHVRGEAGFHWLVASALVVVVVRVRFQGSRLVFWGVVV